MSVLSGQWAKWAANFAARSARERVVVAAALVFGGGLLLFSFGLEPLLLKARNASRAEAGARTELALLQAQLAAIRVQAADPDAVNRRRLAQARQELGAVGRRLVEFEAGMVPPAKMQAFLERLLVRNQSIELLGLKTLPVTLVGVPPPAQAAQAATGGAKPVPGAAEPAKAEGIYQHGIEIRLAGNYNDLLTYLAEVERMPQRLMWNSLSFTVEKYPRNIMVVRVFTLSLDRNWLTV